MSNNKTPKTPTKQQTSPAKFVKPADLFKMRRRTSTNITSNNSNNNDTPTNQNKGESSLTNISMRSSPLKLNHNSSHLSNLSPAFHIEPQSPLKCLNNITDPSPTKKLPILLRNPFNRPVKRRLNLGFSPRKDSSIMRSPNKRTKMLELDEDANLEPPKMKQTSSPRKNRINGPCYQNDWTLKTKLRINFDIQCKNWSDCSSSTHKRLSGPAALESPSKLNDNTISIEAIKNVSKVYQHPYLAWLPLYPRITLEFDKKKDNPFTLTKHSQVTKMMHKDWCESLDDLFNLLIDGTCPYFYMCSDNYNILFKLFPSSNLKKPFIQAFISPFSYGMGCELNKIGVEFKCPEISRSNSSNALHNMARENSQASFGSSQTRTTFDDNSCSHGLRQMTQNNKVTPSIDSGNVSDLDDDNDFGEDENDDTSQFLESIGLSQQDFPSLQSKRKGFVEADSNTQSKSTSNKPLSVIEGADNIRKLVNFLRNNHLYTISNVGKFACIPPTLLSPREFRLSTPQYPEVILSKNMIEAVPTNEVKQQACSNVTPKMNDNKASSGKIVGPTFVELKGTILPNLYNELHKLMSTSDNIDHTCLSTTLDSSIPFRTLEFQQL